MYNVAKMEIAKIGKRSVMGSGQLGMYNAHLQKLKAHFQSYYGQKRKCKLFVKPKENLARL